MTVVLTAILLFSGAATANGDHTQQLPGAGTTPDSALYGLEIAWENIGTALIFGEKAEAERMANLASERAAEMNAVAANNGSSDAVTEAAERYEEQLGRSNALTEAAQQAGEHMSDVSTVVAAATSIHLSVLNRVAGQVPEQAREAVLQARNRSRQGQVEALNALNRDSPGQAADKGMDALHNRADDARTAAEDGSDAATTRSVHDIDIVQDMVSQIGQENRRTADTVSNRMTDHVSGLDEVEDAAEQTVPQMERRVEQVRGEAVDQHVDTMRRLSQEDPVQAAEAFVKAADTRLERANQSAEEDVDDTNTSVNEFATYSAFGQEISGIAQQVGGNVTKVNQLVATATSHHLTVLQDVMEKVPPQARDAISRAMEQSRTGREQAVSALEDRGIPVPEDAQRPETQQQNRSTQDSDEASGNQTQQNGQTNGSQTGG